MDGTSLAVHITDAHGPSSVIPGNSFFTEQEPNSFNRIEDNECVLCDKVFSTRNEKDDHMQSHVGALPFA